MGYRFGQLFVPIQSPESDPRLAILLGVVIPWLLFVVFFLVGLVFMRFYRKGLRRHRASLVEQLVQSKAEKRAVPFLQQLRIEWPMLVLGLIWGGLILYGDSAQGAMWSWSSAGGLMASVVTTYAERKRIYEDAVNASGEAIPDGGSPSSIRNLSVRARTVLTFLALILCVFSGFIIWTTGRIVWMVGDLLEIIPLQ